MKTPLFIGSSVAIITPYTDTGVNYEKLAQVIDFQISGGSAAIIVNGTTGECSTQGIDEHIEVVDFTVKHAAGRIKVIAGSGSNDTNAAVTMGKAAKASGADGLLCVTPYYNRTTQLGLIKHYYHIADHVNLPIMIYHVPSRTTMTATAQTFYELSKHPYINGVKEASKDVNLMTQTMALCADDFYFWAGDDVYTVACMALGGKGTVSVMGNFLPKVMAELCDLCLKNDFKAARELSFKYAKPMDAMFIEVNPIPVKAAMNLLGMNVGGYRLPLCEIEPAHLEMLKNVMLETGLDIVVQD